MGAVRWLRAVPLLVLAACATYGATNSPFTDETATEVPELEGTWIARDLGLADAVPADSGCLTVTRVPDRLAYRVALSEHGGCGEPDQVFEVRLGELGGELVAAVRPAVDFEDDDFVLSLYQFLRVRVDGDSLGAVAMDADTLLAHLVEHPTALPHALLDGEGPDVLLLGTPEQLRDFLAAHARDARFWASEEIALRFQRNRDDR